jgi:hypothetical protein
MLAVKGIGKARSSACKTEATNARCSSSSPFSFNQVARGLPISVPSRRREKSRVISIPSLPAGACQQANSASNISSIVLTAARLPQARPPA